VSWKTVGALAVGLAGTSRKAEGGFHGHGDYKADIEDRCGL
jgi:hypothetical protein